MPKYGKPFQGSRGYKIGKGKSKNATNIARRIKGQPKADEEWQILVNDSKNWQVPVFGEPYFIDPRTRKIVSSVYCPPDVQRTLRLKI